MAVAEDTNHILPTPPYYAVIFRSYLKENPDGYSKMGVRMEELAKQQDGFLGLYMGQNETRERVTISYWRDEESIKQWKQNIEHLDAQRLGKEKWYKSFTLEIARVERAYGMDKT